MSSTYSIHQGVPTCTHIYIIILIRNPSHDNLLSNRRLLLLNKTISPLHRIYDATSLKLKDFEFIPGSIEKP